MIDWLTEQIELVPILSNSLPACWCVVHTHQREFAGIIRKVYAESVHHLKPKGVSLEFLHDPSHIASVLCLLISKPLISLNPLNSLSNWETESRSRTKTVVSSAYCVLFNSLCPTWIPLIVVSFCKARARSSIPVKFPEARASGLRKNFWSDVQSDSGMIGFGCVDYIAGMYVTIKVFWDEEIVSCFRELHVPGRN